MNSSRKTVLLSLASSPAITQRFHLVDYVQGQGGRVMMEDVREWSGLQTMEFDGVWASSVRMLIDDMLLEVSVITFEDNSQHVVSGTRPACSQLATPCLSEIMPTASQLSGIHMSLGSVRQIKGVYSASTVRRNWCHLGKWHEVEGATYKHPSLREFHNLFDAYWMTYGQSFMRRAASLETAACVSETSKVARDLAYEHAAKLISTFRQHMLWCAQQNTAGQPVTGVSTSQHDTAVYPTDTTTTAEHGDQTRIDVGQCLPPPSVVVDGTNLYTYLCQSHVIKAASEHSGRPSTQGALDGEAQLVTRAAYSLAAKNIRGEDHIFPGAVSTGICMKSAIVRASPQEGRSEIVITPWLQLAGAPVSDGRRNVYHLDTSHEGAIRELTFHAWLVSRESTVPMRAAAQPKDLLIEPDDELIIQPSSAIAGCLSATAITQSSLPATDSTTGKQPPLHVKITGSSNGILTGVVPSTSGSVAVLVKVGEDRVQQALANHVGLPWEAFYQVEREMAVREQLQHPVRNLAPLFNAGVITNLGRSYNSRSSNNSGGSLASSSNDGSVTRRGSSSVIGRSALVMLQTGQPLAPPNLPLPVLRVKEAMVLLACLLAFVVDLHLQGVKHGDMKPACVGIKLGAPPRERYFAFDLGAAVANAIERLIDAVHPTLSAPLQCSPVLDLEYSGQATVCGWPCNLRDSVQSVVFTTIRLTGYTLPWTHAAAAGDADAVLAHRRAVSEDPNKLIGISVWPSNAHELACAAMTCHEDKVLLQLVQSYLANTAAPEGNSV